MDSQIVKCSDHQKVGARLLWIFWLSPLGDWLGPTTQLPPHSLLRTFWWSINIFFFYTAAACPLSSSSSKRNQVWVMRLSQLCKTIDKHHLCTSEVPSLIISFSVYNVHL
jgi:hypothetical protein